MANYDNADALSEIRRSFHTLKGSGRLVGANVVGELAWSVENMLNRVIDGTIDMSEESGVLIKHVIELLPDLVADFEHQRPPSHDTAPLQDLAGTLANGGKPAAPADTSEIQGEIAASAGEPAIDPVLRDIFKTETQYHLEAVDAFVSNVQAANESQEITDDLSRAMHTLKGSANTAGIAPIAAVAIPAEKFIKELRARNISADGEIASLLASFAGFIRRGLDQIETQPQATIDGVDDFLGRIESLSGMLLPDQDAETSAEKPADTHLITLFLTEGVDILLDAEKILSDWNRDHQFTDEIEKLAGELSDLAEGANAAGLQDVGEMANAMVNLYQSAVAARPSADSFFELAGRGQEALISMMDQLAAGLATNCQPALAG